MREAGLVEDDDDLDGFALVNQTVGDETEEAKLKQTLIDGEGDTAMEGQEVSERPPMKRKMRAQERIVDDNRCLLRRPLQRLPTQHQSSPTAQRLTGPAILAWQTWRQTAHKTTCWPDE